MCRKAQRTAGVQLELVRQMLIVRATTMHYFLAKSQQSALQNQDRKNPKEMKEMKLCCSVLPRYIWKNCLAPAKNEPKAIEVAKYLGIH